MLVTAWSIVADFTEQRALMIPSFMLWLCGLDKLRLSCNLPGWLWLGITPNLLDLTYGMSRGQTILPAWTSASKYSSTGLGFIKADCMLSCDCMHLCALSKPIWNPRVMPSSRYCTKDLSGWWASSFCHCAWINRVVTVQARGGSKRGRILCKPQF